MNREKRNCLFKVLKKMWPKSYISFPCASVAHMGSVSENSAAEEIFSANWDQLPFRKRMDSSATISRAGCRHFDPFTVTQHWPGSARHPRLTICCGPAQCKHIYHAMMRCNIQRGTERTTSVFTPYYIHANV